ncbi:MAG: hypothetical protein Q9227_005999 [Pyrenula ochraceoflavens]
MASHDGTPPRSYTPQSIPLQDLSRPPDNASPASNRRNRRRTSSSGSIRLASSRHSLLGRNSLGKRYERIEESDGSQEASTRQNRQVSEPLRLIPYDARRNDNPYGDIDETASPLEDLGGFAAAHVGLSFDNKPSQWDSGAGSQVVYDEPPSASKGRRSDTAYSRPQAPHLESETDITNMENDTTPLTKTGPLRPINTNATSSPRGQKHDRQSKRMSVHWLDGGDSTTPSLAPQPGPRLGDDLPHLETGISRKQSQSNGITRSLSSKGQRSRARSLSPNTSASPMTRASSMVRAISQRVVNLSNEPEVVESTIRRKSSSRHARLDRPPSMPAFPDFPPDGNYNEASDPQTPIEKVPSIKSAQGKPDFWLEPAQPNPLRGKSLGIFSPDNVLRKFLCEVLVHPAIEPIILVLIILQTILLAVDSAPSVFNDPRSKSWGSSKIDYAILGLFVVYTLEIVSRIIVSGFFLNAEEYSTIDRSQGFRRAFVDRAEQLFAPQRSVSVRKGGPTEPSQPSVIRSFTSMQPNPDMPGSGRQQQRIRLARRAFLRHSFNRLDFVAVISFWISFGMALTQYESDRHIYVFRMLSCLRILRLLGLTSGTSIILRSLKKAAPLLVNVAFLIGFFWLLFAIVGVQAFKASLRRTCTWVGPPNIGNYTQNTAPENLQFCGGHLDRVSGEAMPWIFQDGANGTTKHKGFLCPQGSLCIQGDNPYNGTVSFDNVLQSLEMVFVVISSNTFSDIMYYLTDSDYLAAAIFFAAGIVIMSLWLMNLLVAVITSSFQIIREESKRSAFTAEELDDLPAEDVQDTRRVSSIKRLYDRTYWVWILVIVVGLVVQCLRSSVMGDDRKDFINNTESIVTLILLFEIILRFASDWRTFFQSKRNIADLILAVVTSVIQIPPIRHSGQPFAWLSIFQIARIYRIVMAFRITRDLIMTVYGNIVGLLNLIVFVFLITFLTAILASQLFRGDIDPTDQAGSAIHITFFDIFNSFLGMYQVLSSENWTSLLYTTTAFDFRWNTSWLAATFFIMWFILANFIVLNMFIAVIQESFDVSEDEKRLQQVKAFLQQKELSGSSHGNLSLSSIFKLGRDSMRRRDPLDYGPATMEMLLKDAVVKEFLDEQDETQLTRPRSDMTLPEHPVTAVESGILSAIWNKITGFRSNRDPNPFYSTLKFSRAYEDLDPRRMAKEVVSAAEQRRRLQRQYLQRHPRYNVSLFLFGPTNPIRRLCQRIVGPGRGDQRIEGVDPYKPLWYSFSAFIYCAIVAMVLLACITTPLYQREYFKNHTLSVRNWFVWTDLGFAILFSLEAIIKVIADGFFWTPNAYFRSSWGFIDGLVLVTLWINVLTSLYRDDGVSRAVGAFKALRALRLLNVSDSARDTFHSLIIVGGAKLISAAFVSISLLIPFAIYGLNLFNGQMESCNNPGFPARGNLTNCVGEYNNTPFNWPVLSPTQVSNPSYSFDNFGSALFILFQIVSQEGWTDVMWSGMSATGKGLQPADFAAQGNALYFVAFNLLGAVFVLTLFVSVFMRNYTELTGVAFLTADQRSWLELRKLLRQISPSKRSLRAQQRRWQSWCYRVAVKKHGKWQRFTTTMLMLHLTLLIVEFYPSKVWWDRLRDYVFLLFTVFFIANIVIRIVGLGWKRFRTSSWDIYSIFAVTGTVVTTFMVLSNYNNRAFTQLHKLFLVSIALLLIPRNNQLDQLFKTAAASLTSIGNLLATWFVLFLVYAIAFTQTFSLTRFGSNESGNLNFRNVIKALILLFRMSMGEGWNAIMEDFATITPPNCVMKDSFFESDCGSGAWARGLFISWNIFSMYIFVSLFVSLIFESFSYVYQRSSGLSVISREEIRRFKQAWATFDPDGSGYISKEAFPRLLGELSGVFQMRIYDGDFTVRSLIDDCKADRRESINNPRIVAGIDLDKLSERLQSIPIHEVRRRRARMNVFFEEVLVSADPDRGISFTSCLMILAHYNVISDSKSLRLEEFLRRRARLQRVEEAVRRNVVIGFFDTLYWSRAFRRALHQRHSSRMTGVPSFTVPEIFVDDPENLHSRKDTTPRDFTEPTPPTFTYNVDHASSSSGVSSEVGSRGVSPLDTARFQRRDSAKSSPGQSDVSPAPSPALSPHRLPQLDTSYGGAGTTSRAASPTSLRAHSPTLEPEHAARDDSSMRVSGIAESFDNSAWGESIRRSFTLRRPGYSEDRSSRSSRR